MVDNFQNEQNQGLDPGNTASTLVSGNATHYIDMMKNKADQGDIAALQWMANYAATKMSEKSARDWTAQREDYAYTRLMDDLKRAGISPYVLSGATPMVSSSSGKSYSGTELVSRSNNEKSNNSDIWRSIIQFLGIVALKAAMFA